MLAILKSGLEVYRPEQILSSVLIDGEISLSIYNTSEVVVTNPGIYLSPPKNLGDVDNPADMGPYIDYNHLLTWGTESISLGTYGGLKIEIDGVQHYFSFKKGNSSLNKIGLGEMEPGGSVDIKIILEVPPAISSRRLYIAINVE